MWRRQFITGALLGAIGSATGAIKARAKGVFVENKDPPCPGDDLYGVSLDYTWGYDACRCEEVFKQTLCALTEMGVGGSMVGKAAIHEASFPHIRHVCRHWGHPGCKVCVSRSPTPDNSLTIVISIEVTLDDRYLQEPEATA